MGTNLFPSGESGARICRRILLAALFLALTAGALAQRRLPPPMNPRTVASRSGNATVWINPSEPNGSGSALYRVTVGGKLAWEGTLPFTLSEAALTDDGTLSGCGYTEGSTHVGGFVVAIVDPTGKVRLEDRTKQEGSRYEHGLPNPRAEGLMFDPDNDRMILRVAGGNPNTRQATWWVYSLSKSARTETLTPGSEDIASGTFMCDAKLVPGTPLVITNWYRFDKTMGQFFTLLDPAAKQVWRIDLPGDYESNAPKGQEFELGDSAMAAGTILSANAPNRFELRYVKKAQRVTFEVKRKGDGWEVKEVSRKPFLKPSQEPPTVRLLGLKPTELKTIRKVVLPLDEAPISPIHDIKQFFVWQDKLVTLQGNGVPTLCVVDNGGHLVRTIALPKEAQKQVGVFLAKTSGSNFVLLAKLPTMPVTTGAWRVDVATGKWTPLGKLNTFDVMAVAGFPSGDFAVLSTERLTYSSNDHLSYYSPSGKLLWTRAQDGYSGGPEEMLSPEAIAADAKGRVVVLDNIRHTLQFFDKTGHYTKTIDLEKKWGREPSYLTDIACLPDGKFWLYDFSAPKPCYLLDANGGIVRNFTPRFASGKPFRVEGATRTDSQGNAWVTNGQSLLRLNTSGKVVQTIGAPLRESGLGDIAWVHVSWDGKIYALDTATSVVHVFDHQGKKLFTCTPNPSEFEEQAMATLDVTRSGDIYVSGTVAGGYLHFAPDGKRIGNVPWNDDEGKDGPFAWTPELRWDGDRLVNDKGISVARLRRWPDQRWMSGPSAVAPDGRLMAIGEPGRDGKTGQRMAFFDSSGKPEAMVFLGPEMPEANNCAYDGKRSYFVTDNGLVAVNRAGKYLWLYSPKGWNDKWQVFPSLGGIAVYDGKQTIQWLDPEPSR